MSDSHQNVVVVEALLSIISLIIKLGQKLLFLNAFVIDFA